MTAKMCVLYDGKVCDDCGECEYCDLDPSKKCTNCGKCLDDGFDYSAIQIDDISDDDGSNDDAEDSSDLKDWKFEDEDDEQPGEDGDVVFIDDVEGLGDKIEGYKHLYQHGCNVHQYNDGRSHDECDDECECHHDEREECNCDKEHDEEHKYDGHLFDDRLVP